MDHRALFRLLPWPAVVVDRELIVRDATAAFATVTGLSPDDLVGRALRELLAPLLDGALPSDVIRAALAGDMPSPSVVAMKPSAEARRLTMHAIPAGDDGALLCFSASADGESGPLNERLETLSAALRSIKHEINNPLTGALGNINMLLRRDDWDEKTRRRLTTAEQEMKKIGQIVVRLADLVPPSRLSAQDRGRSA